MADNSTDRLTLARRFLEPANSTHRRDEALRAFFVEQTSSAEAAARFGYTPGSFRVLVHQFRKQPDRDFFAPTIREGRPPGKQKRLRERVMRRVGTIPASGYKTGDLSGSTMGGQSHVCRGGQSHVCRPWFASRRDL
jgi:hypothetical protein